VAVAHRTRSIPEPAWWLVHRLLLENTGVVTLERIVDAGVDTLLVCGPDDLLPISLGSEARVRRLEARSNFHIEVLDDFDHSSWPLYQRLRMIDVLSEHIGTHFGTGSSGARSVTTEAPAADPSTLGQTVSGA
jgi:hypothetical protein